MALDDFMESRVAVAVAATAAVFSPRVRGVIRQGAVYGVAGVMKAVDAVSSAARDVASDARGTAGEDGAPSTARRRTGGRTTASSA